MKFFCDRLNDYLNNQIAESIEISEMCNIPPQDEEYQTLNLRSSDISIYESKITTKEKTTKQKSDRNQQKPYSIAAAQQKKILREEKSQLSRNHYSDKLTALTSQKKVKLETKQLNTDEEESFARVDYIINKKKSKLVPLLDSAGVPVNRTIKDLLKLYPAEKVERAIAIVKTRKREQYIPSLSGYFVAALKGDWGAKNLVSEEGCDRQTQEIDKAAIFRHWYDLGRELGYYWATVQDKKSEMVNSGRVR